MSTPRVGETRTPAAPPALNGNTGKCQEHLSMNVLVREARKAAGDLGLLPVANSVLRGIVRRYLRECPDLDLRSWFISYADPTGERATKNVMKARGY